MLVPLLTHLAAALLALLAVSTGKTFLRRRRARAASGSFWDRQHVQGLADLGWLEAEQLPPPLEVIELQGSTEMTLLVISAAREHGALAYLEQHPGASAEQLAALLGFSVRQVRAALEVLFAAGVVERRGAGFALTSTARSFLSPDSPLGLPLPPPIISKKQLQVLRSGLVSGAVKQWEKGRDRNASTFSLKMHQTSFPLGFALHSTGLLREARTVMDMAGGAGSVCIALALREPSLRLTLAELPDTLSTAQRMIARYGVSERIQCLGMDMFAREWPGGFDAIVFTNIFHDWSDEQCHLLARKAFQALRPGGKVLLIEALLNEDTPGPLWTAHLSLSMALRMQGRQFRGGELTTLLQAEGFTHARVRPLRGHFSVIEAVRPD